MLELLTTVLIKFKILKRQGKNEKERIEEEESNECYLLLLLPLFPELIPSFSMTEKKREL